MSQVIVIGGGLAGLSAAHTILERGGRVCVLEKNSFCGGNSTKATSGINGALTRVQIKNGIQDSTEVFLRDTALSASKGKSDVPSELNRVLVNESAPAVHWLIDRFGLDLSLLGRLGGASFPRTHRGAERFPGMVITYCLMQTYDKIIEDEGTSRARLLTRCRATKLIQENGTVVGVEYLNIKTGQTLKEYGPVIIATGGFASDFSKDGILASVRGDLLHLPTTNGDHCTGDGLKMAQELGAGDIHLEYVQVHPTGLVNPAEPDAKVLFLAAEALRGCGGLILDNQGQRVCDELGRRDYVTGEMQKRNKYPYRLVLSKAAAEEIEWHCKHYTGRGLMKYFKNGHEISKELGIPSRKLAKCLSDYNEIARTKKDPYGKRFFANTPINMEEYFYVAIITPVIHYCMGGITIGNGGEVLTKSAQPIPGLFSAGEVAGGVHGLNRLGGSSLLDCVVFGRVSGASAAKFLLDSISQGAITGPPSSGGGGGSAGPFTVSVDPSANQITVNWGSGAGVTSGATVAPQAPAAASSAEEPKPEPKELLEYDLDEVAKHTSDDDVWIAVNGRVLDVTSFLDDHPGGKKALMLYAGKDASEEFNMLHEPDVVDKYAPEVIIGTLKGATQSKL
uniref:Flavocytochrome c n=1 Tax=Hirondellea gigas TaxID=1518452 RepID=A0A6A7G054_9CRUS